MNDSTIVIELPLAIGIAREVIERRLRFAEKISGLAEGQGLNISDKAFSELERVSQNSPGLALTALDLVLRTSKPHKLPYTLTFNDVQRAQLTPELVETYHDSPLRDAAILSYDESERDVINRLLKQ